MDVKCQSCFNITTVFSQPQTAVVCGNCQTVLCQPTGAGQMEHHMFPNFTSHPHQFPSPNPTLYDTPSPNPSLHNSPLPRFQSDSWRSPVQYSSPRSGNAGNHNFSRPWNMSGNSSGHSYYSNSSKGGLSSSRHAESPMSSTHSAIRGSPHSHSSGRGWQYRGGSPSPGWSGGRGRGGYHRNKGYGLGRQQLDSFYVKSMVKDPWRKLKPVIGNILIPLSGPQSWLPKSVSAKKVKVDETVGDIKPKQNLAEFLALAFEETTNDDQQGEGLIMPNPSNILVPLSEPQSWLPKSVSAKKVKVDETVGDIKPKQNLAEFLALAFEETINDEQQGEGLIMPNPNDHSDRVG